MFFSKDIVHQKLLNDIQAANCWGQLTHRDAFDKVRELIADGRAAASGRLVVLGIVFGRRFAGFERGQLLFKPADMR